MPSPPAAHAPSAPRAAPAPPSPVPGVQDALDQVAALHRECRFDDARPHLRGAVDLQTSGGGASPFDVAVWRSIGERQRAEGDVAGARASFERAIAIVTRDAPDPQLLVALLGLRGAMESRLELRAEAQATREHAYAVATRSGGADPTSVLDALWESTRDAAGDAAADARLSGEGIVRVVRAGRGTNKPLPAIGTPLPCTPSASDRVPVPDAASVVAGMSGDMRRCYNERLAAQPQLQGRFRLLARIDGAGDPIEVVAYVPRGDLAGLAECAAARVAAAKFTSPANGAATLVLPLTFLPE